MPINIAKITDAIMMIKKKANTNIAIITNVIASNARASANIAVTINANKTANNTRK